METTDTPHEFMGRPDRWCEKCAKPDRDPIHTRHLSDPWVKSARLERENDELAKGVLDLTRRLTIAEQRTKHAEELAERAMADAGLWRRAGTAYQSALCRVSEENAKRIKAAAALGVMDDIVQESGGGLHPLPLAYFPVGEEPGARWGLTELGQAAVDERRAKGPEWTLLLSPDPREVLSIEVRRGSRQEAIYRSAGYVTAEDPDVAGGYFLGLLEAFSEVARAQDEAMGRAMQALEKLFLYGVHEKAVVWLERMEGKVADALLRTDYAEGTDRFPSYDLAAICARCGRIYGDHVLPLGPACEGFLAVAEDGPLPFLCVACMEKKPLGERAPSTMPLCNECWKKEP